MLERELVLTPAGLRRLRNQLDQLVTIERASIAADIRQARQPGELEECPEYTAAKAAQAMVEHRIATLRSLVGTARVLQPSDIPPEVSALGSVVRLRDLVDGDEWEVTLVSSPEADPDEDLISIDCPLGEALLGRMAGETVEVDTPSGKTQYRITGVEPSQLER